MKRKVLNILMSAAVIASMLAGCGGTSASSPDSSSSFDSASTSDSATTSDSEAESDTAETENGETYKIGVIMYQWTDAQGANIQNYCNYLQENMNVEFQFESTFYDDDAQVSCVENLISAGCDAIISGYDTNIIAAMNTCDTAGVYYAVALDHITEDDFAGSAPGQYFLGGTKQFGGNLGGLGEKYAEAVIASGIDNIGGISFPAWAFSDAPEIYTGFQNALKTAGVTVQDLSFSSGFTAEEVKSATQTLINENSDIQAIFGMSSGLDYVYPALQDTDVKLISMGYDTSVKSLMENGSLIAAGNNNHTQAIASCVARIINALEGNSYSDAESGAYNEGSIVNGVAGYPVIGNLEALEDYETYVVAEDGSKGSVTVEELKNCIISINSEATLADLNTLTNRTVEEVKALR